MFRIVENRKWYFLLSALVIVPGLIAMIYSLITTGLPFKLAVDFTGGSLWELNFSQVVPANDLRSIFVEAGYPDTAVIAVGNGLTMQVRSKPLDEAARLKLLSALKAKYVGVTEQQFSSVGPTIGREVTQAAVVAVGATALVILLFLIVAFRQAPHPFRYGVSAIVALAHDLTVMLGTFSIFSLLFGWEADALFLTAVLTVIGFSVQDTIVVFDRVRENVRKYRGEQFSRIVNRSLLETTYRSLATNVTAMFVMVAILVFGGPTIKQFIAMLLVGVTTGSYSSIFNAAQVLVGWDEGDVFGLKVPSVAADVTTPSLA